MRLQNCGYLSEKSILKQNFVILKLGISYSYSSRIYTKRPRQQHLGLHIECCLIYTTSLQEGCIVSYHRST